MAVPMCQESVPGAETVILSVSPPTDLPNALYKWCFTIKESLIENNVLSGLLVPKCRWFLYQLENGKEAGNYHHYQGTLCLKVKQRWGEVLQWLPRGTHLEDTRSEGASLRYCMKEETRIGGPWGHGLGEDGKPIQKERKRKEKGEVDPPPLVERPLYLISELRPWQSKVEQLVQTESGRRTVHWIWSIEGHLGRTQLCKYLSHKYGAVACQNGKASDVLDLCTKMSKTLTCAIWNMGREIKKEKIPYLLLETIKDGYWFSGKYETSMVNINSPHVLVFANTLPERSKLSADRWCITRIEDVTEETVLENN